MKGRFEMRRVVGFGVVILLSIIAGAACGATQYEYFVTDLGDLYGNTGSWGQAINTGGQVVGYAPISSGSYHAFLYSNGSMADLGTITGFSNSYAYGINDSGQVVGSLISAGGATDAFLDSNGTMTNLGSGTAYGINDSGQVVGKNASSHAFLDNGGTMKDLGTLAGYATSSAQGINAGGQVVGYATTNTGGTQAFLYSGGSMMGLGVPAGDANSTAEAINSAGQVVGYARPTVGSNHAFLYSNGTMTDLGTLSGDVTSQALGINDIGQVVGYSGGRAFLYSGGTMMDLSTLVAPSEFSNWTLQEALDINDNQQIVAVGVNGPGQPHALLLTPVIPGDANLDGKVDVNDLTIVLSNFGQTTANVTWSTGDFNGDGQVDVNDLTILLSNFGQSIGASSTGIKAVPEPSTFALLGIGAIALLAFATCLLNDNLNRSGDFSRLTLRASGAGPREDGSDRVQPETRRQ